MISVSQCALCKHVQGHTGDRLACTAFPNGIPEPISKNEFDHRQPYIGDQGILFSSRRELFGAVQNELFLPDESDDEFEDDEAL